MLVHSSESEKKNANKLLMKIFDLESITCAPGMTDLVMKISILTSALPKSDNCHASRIKFKTGKNGEEKKEKRETRLSIGCTRT